MAAPKFISEIVSHKSLVVVTNTQQQLSKIVIEQLRKQKDLVITEIVDANTDNLLTKDVNIVVHFAGFGKPSFAQTLYHTSALHRLLDFALRNHAKFVLVLPEENRPEQQTAIVLAQQFGKNFNLRYTIITVPASLDTKESATAIIRSFIHNFKPAPPAEVIFPTNKPTKTTERTDRFWVRTLTGLVTILLIPWLIFLAGLGLTGYSLRCGRDDLVAGNWSVAKRCGQVVENTSKILSQERLWVLGNAWVLSYFGLGQPDLFVITSRLGQNIQQLAQIGELSTSGHLSDIGPKLPGLLEQLAYSQADLQRLPRAKAWVSELADLRVLIAKVNLVLPGVERIFAAPKQNWLVLLQDADELRPSGGFIGNFALVSLENGQITDVQIHDTESTDGLLRGHVDPPSDLASVTHQNNWYLRDSNWDPDFSASASKAAWFVEKELDLSVDGVIGVNSNSLNLLAKILDINSGVDVKTLSTNLFDKLKTTTGDQQRRVLAFTLTQLENRQLAVVSSDLSQSLSATEWDGGLVCCKQDTFYVVDSNVGVNKVNPQIKSAYKLDISESPTTRQYTFQLSYTNTSSSEAWPLGDYADYVRVLAPQALKLDQTTIDGKAINVNESGQAGFAVWGMLINVPVGQSKTVVLTTHRDGAGPVGSLYPLRWLNQPGAQPIPLTIASGGQIGYNAVLSSPIQTSIKLN